MKPQTRDPPRNLGGCSLPGASADAPEDTKVFLPFYLVNKGQFGMHFLKKEPQLKEDNVRSRHWEEVFGATTIICWMEEILDQHTYHYRGKYIMLRISFAC